jgi:hypothetical protein
MHWTAEPVPAADREQFLRDNAVSIVDARDARIDRLRREIRRLHRQAATLRQQLAKARERGFCG